MEYKIQTIEMGFSRTQAAGGEDLILWESVDVPKKGVVGVNVDGVWQSAVHKLGVIYASEGCHYRASPRRGLSCQPIVT